MLFTKTIITMARLGIFGIFDFGFNRKCMVLDSRFYVSTEKDANVVVKANNFVDGALFVDITADAEVEQIANKQYYDKDALKRHTIMKKAKLGISAGIIVATVITLILLLF